MSLLQKLSKNKTDLTNQRFGKLIAIKPIGKDKYGQIQWQCRCDCGNIITTPTAYNLMKGAAKSCGCLQKELVTNLGKKNGLPYGDAPLHKLYSNYLKKAKIGNREFALTREQFKYLTSGICYYCGKQPNQKIRGFRLGDIYFYNGIDRVDNERGYTIDNCVSCCKRCNTIKKAIGKFMIKKAYVFLLRNGAYDE